MQPWSVEGQELSGKVDAPPAFLDEATRAMQAHAPLRVEPQRFIQALRAGDLLSVNEARGAVRALHATARRWHEVAEQHGRPRVQPLPPPEPAPAPPSTQESRAPEPAPPPEPTPSPAPLEPTRPSRRKRRKRPPRQKGLVRPVSSNELVVDFNALPRVARERFVQATHPQATRQVAPILTDLRFRSGRWWTCITAGIGAFCLYSLYQLATNYRTFGVAQPPLAILVYALCLFCVLAAAGVLLFQGRWRRALPFHPGRYVLPLDFVDATTRHLRIIPLEALEDLQIIHHSSLSHLRALVDLKIIHPSSVRSSLEGHFRHTVVTLRFKGREDAETFVIHDQELAKAQSKRMEDVYQSIASGQAPERKHPLRTIDPFSEARDRLGGFKALQNAAPPMDSGEGPLAQDVPRLFRPPFLLLLAVLATAVLSPTLWRVRNHRCDEAAFEAALRDPSDRQLEWYARSGGKHTADARDIGTQRAFRRCEQADSEACWTEFLSMWPLAPQRQEVEQERRPRAAFKATPRTLWGLNKFLKSYPDSGVAAMVREQLIPELEFRELSSLSVTELRRFRWRYPRSPMKAKVDARIHELFAAAQAELQRQASPQNPQAVLFLRELLTFLESSESALVQVRFRRQIDPALPKAWGAVSTDTLESRTVKALGSAFRQVFTDGILTPIYGESLPEQPDDTGVKDPQIDIRYTLDKSGGARVQFNFDVALRRPGAQPVRIRYQVTPSQDLPQSGPGTTPSDSAVYNDMAQHAFEKLSEKLCSVFFRADSQAAQACHP